MPTFAYQARDKGGRPITGTREASSQQAALQALRDQGFYVTELKNTEVSEPRSSPFNRFRSASSESSLTGAGTIIGPVSPKPLGPTPPVAPAAPKAGPNVRLPAVLLRSNSKNLSLFYSQMHAMLSAGTVLSHALKAIERDGPSSSIRRAAGEMCSRTASGMQWSDAMREYPGLFSELQIAMIGAGEMGGFVDVMCERLAAYCERDYKIQQSIKSETWYPKLLVFASFLIPSVVPLVLAAHNNQNWFVAWLHSVGGPFTVIFFVWAFFKIRAYVAPVAARQGPMRYALDWLKLHTPIVAKITRSLATAKFCRAMSATYAAGVGAGSMLRISGNACGNEVFRMGTPGMIRQMESGVALSKTLEQTGHFHGIALTMLRTGEDTGKIDTQLDRAADFLEADAEMAIKQSIPVLGILCLLGIGIYIGMTVVQFYLGYFNSVFDAADAAGG